MTVAVAAPLSMAAPARDAQRAATGACAHCGESLDAPASRYCCDGCAAAAQWISDAGLSDYYRLRDGYAARVGTDAVDLSAWDRDDVIAGHARAIDGGHEITVLADGMRCAACAWLIDRAIAREPGVLEVNANAVTGRVRIAWDPARTPLSAALRRLAALGYRPWLATGQAREDALRAERNRSLLRLGVAGLGAMQAMMFAEALYLDFAREMPLPTRDFLRWVTMLVSTPVVFYSGWPFLAGAWRELRARMLGMDVLVAGATLLAYGASVVETLRGGAHVWFDAAVMFVFLLLAARLLEQRARRLANARVDALARARPAFATRERADGSRELVPLAALRVGDVACVAVGEVVPADGTVLDAAARFEESLLTGESEPVLRGPGDPVLAGSACREQPARLRIDAVGAQTRLSQLTRLVEHAQAQRPALATLADRIASRFVAVLLIAAVALYVAWRVHDPARAFEVTLALLVITCPCALSLAVPAALASAHGALARSGVLALRGDALERLADATDVVFDKTGTLCDRAPTLASVETHGALSRDAVLAIAAALERDSRHPLAAAFAAYDDGRAVAGLRAVPGHGLEADVDGARWRLGRAAFACGAVVDDDALWLGDGATTSARFVVDEGLRADASATVDALRAQGLALHIASGDADAKVAPLARALQIASAHARQSPEDKLARVRALQRAGRTVAMVGDGINDAPVLAGADVSFAIGDGAALAHRSADFVLVGTRLAPIADAIALARRARRIVRQNLAWAIAYNVVALPLAALGLVTPWLAAVGMALSSLTVTVNALRLRRP